MTIKQTGFQKDIKGTYIEKDPQSILQYGIDWKDWLNLGDDIDTATWTVESTATNRIVTLDSINIDGVALITIKEGVAGTVYPVACKITTVGGFTDVRRFRVKVENRYIP